MKLINVSDMHTLHKAAIACEMEYDDGDDYTPNRLQKILHRWWGEIFSEVKAHVKGHEVKLLIGGDCVDGFHNHGTEQVWGTALQQAQMAIELLAPYAKLAPASVYGLKGTPSHAGSDSEFDRLVIKELGGKCAYHWRLDFDGKLIDWAHHCTLPKDPRNYEAALERQASLIVRRYREAGERVPDLILRQHVHRFARGFTGSIPMITGLGWKLRDEYLAKIDPLGFYEVGVLVFDTADLANPKIFSRKGMEDAITKVETKKSRHAR
jgi:hypothetical protein